MKKRLLTLLTTMLALPAAARAQIVGSGNCGADGDNLTWTLDDADTLTISGEGDMKDYNSPWSDYHDKIKKVVIEDGVTSIGRVAFAGCTSITEITIPDSVTSIGGSAFINTGYYNNEDNWKGDVLYIGKHLIKAKSEIRGNYTIESDTLTIAESAFFPCPFLTETIIPDSVISIDSRAFAVCGKLNVNVSENNPNYSDIDGVLLNKDKTEIIAYAKDVIQPIYTIPSGVTRIDGSAFWGCASLTEIIIPESVKSISNASFFWCTSLTKITIPDSVTSIGNQALAGCSSLTDVYYGGSEADWGNIDTNYGNDPFLSATIHYNSTGPEPIVQWS